MEKRMKWLWLLLAALVLAATGESIAFEGRMAGMADPYGLVYDESDFLIHPSRIADGQGVSYYGYYKFTYTDVGTWSWKTPGINPFGTSGYGNQSHVSGDGFDHDVLIGTAFPVRTGRLGLFFNYTGTRSDYNGNDMLWGWPSLNVSNDADNFSFRAVYGLPLGGSFKFGAEAQIAYHTETASTVRGYSSGSYTEIMQNCLWEDFPFVWPHDYSYWDYQLKAGLQGDIGPANFGVTIRGGSIFSGDNEMNYLDVDSLNRAYALDMKGGVEGYNVGSDIWVRFPVTDRLALPFLFRVDYREKSYDGGPARFYRDLTADSSISLVPTYDIDMLQNNLDLLKIEVGGGVDYTFATGLKLAAGLYYDYIQTDASTYATYWYDGGTYNGNTFMMLYTDYPHGTEHQIKLRVASEKPLSPDYVVRGGLEAFHGWVNEDYIQDFRRIYPSGATYNERYLTGSLGGEHWGILGSIGMTAKIRGVELEPFVQGGWQRLTLDDSNAVITGVNLRLEREREYTLVAAGLAIKF